jgi:sensor histidine kinase regulating citrate/malate metabolism
LEYKETEQINLQLYNRDITKNLQEIREIKHDLKNVFLTMGEYVARSEDAGLKDYYYENIASFAGTELRRNDLYLNLQELQNESIKAFLYYKFLQGFDSCIDMQLETELDHSVIPYISDYSDIIRILGIFIDNAMEESLQVSQGYVRVVIKEKDGQMSFGVKNTVRDTIRQNGIHKGISSKGLGRGYGLSIVEKLVKKHDDIIWNSYFQENTFVQMISTTH